MSPAVRRAARLLLGLAVSAAFVVLTLGRVDLAEVGAALARVSAPGLALAVAVVLVELTLRALRWQRLLHPIAPVSLSRSAAYLTIGYFANSMLPARLGDLARAYLAGRSFRTSRLAVLGTILVERVADGLLILGVVALLGLARTMSGQLGTAAVWLAGLFAVAAAGLVVVLLWVRRAGGGALRVRVREMVEKGLLGTQAVRTVSGFLLAAALTALAFGVAVVSFNLVASAAGLSLSLADSALVMGALALSTSIPAGPGSIGTYEFVGLTMLTSLGVDAETSLAVVVLVHLVATLPLALIGMVAAWALHFRVTEIARDADPELVVGGAGLGGAAVD